MKTATIKERNALFGALKQASPGGVIMHCGHNLEKAAREFEAEGLATITKTDHFDRSALRIVKAWT